MSPLGTGVVAMSRVVRLVLPKRAEPGFTARDRLELQLWAQANARRIEFDDTDEGEFALLYGSDDPWASWAVTRLADTVLIWDSVTLVDLGRFNAMPSALASLPSKTRPIAGTNVIPFPLRRT